MKKIIIVNSLFITALIVPSIAFAQTADVAAAQTGRRGQPDGDWG